MASLFKIRVISPWFGELRLPDAILSKAIPSEEADALLCDWSPSPELDSFPRRKAWYNIEPPRHFAAISNGEWPEIRKRLRPSEFLSPYDSDPRYRVPEITHFGDPIGVNTSASRIDRAVAVVSNFGGSPIRRDPDLQYRNHFITRPHVDLYGRSRGWRRYRHRFYSLPHLPRNFKGDIPGDWEEEAKRDLLARYKVCICLENYYEPYLFSEKFVEAVRAGCVPIFHPHPTVAESFLLGAKWIDPGDDVSRADDIIAHALSEPLEEYQACNAKWLEENEDFKRTSAKAVYARIAEILMEE